MDKDTKPSQYIPRFPGSIAPDLDCGDCRHLDPKEGEQGRAKDRHVCKLTGKWMFHHGLHPQIPRLCECILDGWKEYPEDG